jgi:xylan 1,4-beta-xylosidase
VLAEFDGRYWSFEVAKSFTGRVLGVYAAEGTVSFSDLRYRGTDDVP